MQILKKIILTFFVLSLIVAFGIMQGRKNKAEATIYETILPKAGPQRGDVKGIPLVVDGERKTFFEGKVNKNTLQVAQYQLRDPSVKSTANYYKGVLSKYGKIKTNEIGNIGEAIQVIDHNGNLKTVIVVRNERTNSTEMISLNFDNYKSLSEKFKDYKKTGSATIDMSYGGMESTTYINKNGSTLSSMSATTSSMSSMGWKQDTKMNQDINKYIKSENKDRKFSVMRKNGGTAVIGSHKDPETGEVMTTVIKNTR